MACSISFYQTKYFLDLKIQLHTSMSYKVINGMDLTYPGVLAILDCRLLEGAVDLGRIGLQTESISGCLEDKLSM